jgi:NAD(P)H-hydrate epimerase
MLPVVTAAQMRAIDSETIGSLGIPGAVLMENAGRAVVACVEEELARRPGASVAVLCGPGNNGGDGFVVARVLRERGARVRLYLGVALEALQGDARLHAEAFVKCGGSVLGIEDEASVQGERETILESEILVDALFGTGLQRELAGHWKVIADIINEAPGAVVAVDLPSGLRTDDGHALGVAVEADRTVTFSCAKVAHASAPGFTYCGTLQIAEMGIPVELARQRAEIGIVEPEDIAPALAGDDDNTHKGKRGHVLAIAGSEGKYGAGRLSGLAALRAGAGLVTIAAPQPDSAAEDPLMTASLADPGELEDLVAGKSSVLIGPGMSPGEPGRDVLFRLLQECVLPMVLDADALNHLGTGLDLVAAAKGPAVLTPHPGEAARLLGIGTPEVQADRIRAAREIAKQSRALVVLKGARTCICDGRAASSFVAINPTGGPELSTAGTGDVLAGVLAALLARGIDPLLAARAAAYWHGEAGRLATQKVGGPGLIASDLLESIPAARLKLSSS